MEGGRRNLDLGAALEDARARYEARNPQSGRLHQEACEALPGGNTRTVLYYEPFPVALVRGEGATVWDADGHAYRDFLGEYTAGLYGHSHPVIQAAARSALDAGIDLGGPTPHEGELARLICERFPSCERLRFCNTGTEANLMAITAARAYTGRDAVMVFRGGYHGGVLHFVNGESPVNAPYPFVVGEYNDAERAAETIDAHAADLAAILVEPMMGTSGAIPAGREFLETLRREADRLGIMLIYDEVMTSRLAPGGLQQQLGIYPDLTTFGKYIGGGMTFGAFGGRADLIDQFDPRRPGALPHAGTFNNNVLTMAAGAAGLRDVYTAEVALAHNQRSDRFRDKLNEVATAEDAAAQVTGLGSIMCVHFQREPIRNLSDAAVTAPAARSLFHIEMLLDGVYVGQFGFMSPCLALVEADYEAFEGSFRRFLRDYRRLL